MKLFYINSFLYNTKPAAFRRLCVETNETVNARDQGRLQPPSGGCVLKLSIPFDGVDRVSQPPSGGCVLKPMRLRGLTVCRSRPPSGGCVLKRFVRLAHNPKPAPAAFRRLCVETRAGKDEVAELGQPPSGGCVLKLFSAAENWQWIDQPPSGGCVLKLFLAAENWQWIDQPPSGGCVLKLILQPLWRLCRPSRLQAAVC